MDAVQGLEADQELMAEVKLAASPQDMTLGTMRRRRSWQVPQWELEGINEQQS
jgi:hypothetical protein